MQNELNNHWIKTDSSVLEAINGFINCMKEIGAYVDIQYGKNGEITVLYEDAPHKPIKINKPTNHEDFMDLDVLWRNDYVEEDLYKIHEDNSTMKNKSSWNDRRTRKSK